jgi:hypothetical protein
MISLELAQQLRDAGLAWQPAERDFFVLPGREMDTQVFVVSQLPAMVQSYNGHPVVTFHASVEWALDYVYLGEALWLPDECQLRGALVARLPRHTPLSLEWDGEGYRCTVELAGQPQAFAARDAETAYARALLAALAA